MNEEIKKFGVAKTEAVDPYSGLDIDKERITEMSHC